MIHNFLFFYVMEGITILAKAFVNKTRVWRGLARTDQFGAAVFLLAGFCGNALNVPIVAPLEYLLTQVMTSKTREGMVSIFNRTRRESGIRGFYVGWPVYLMAAPRASVRFGMFDYGKNFMLRGQVQDAVLSTSQAFWLGMVCNILGCCLFYPLNTARIVITSRTKENGDNGDEASSKKASKPVSEMSDNPVEVMLAITREEGVQGLFKGLGSEVLEGVLGGVIQLILKERVTVGVRTAVYFGKT